MPKLMFQDVVSPHGREHRKWYTLPVSFLVHTTILAILIVVPLIATDVIPMPRTVLHYTAPAIMPVVEVPPRFPSIRASRTMQTNVAPVVAPETVQPEHGLIVDTSAVDTKSLDGLSALGVSAISVEALPLVAPVAPVQPVRAGVEITPPSRIKYVAPIYPEIARKSRVQGIVIVEAIIGVDGRVETARVLRSHPLLDEAARAAVQTWEYTPTLLNGRPTPVIMTVTVKFTLN